MVDHRLDNIVDFVPDNIQDEILDKTIGKLHHKYIIYDTIIYKTTVCIFWFSPCLLASTVLIMLHFLFRIRNTGMRTKEKEKNIEKIEFFLQFQSHLEAF